MSNKLILTSKQKSLSLCNLTCCENLVCFRGRTDTSFLQVLIVNISVLLFGHDWNGLRYLAQVFLICNPNRYLGACFLLMHSKGLVNRDICIAFFFFKSRRSSVSWRDCKKYKVKGLFTLFQKREGAKTNICLPLQITCFNYSQQQKMNKRANNLRIRV